MSKSPNHFNGRNGWKPDIIVCHVTEGAFAGAVSWLCNPASKCSAHYVVGANGQTEQLVDLKDGAWCNGNTTDSKSRLYYKNALNPIVKSRAANANYYTYSIEHEGYSYKERYGALTEAQYQASLAVMKKMITHMKDSYGVTFQPDRDHLIGHYAIDPQGKPNCPAPKQGANFPFDRFITDIKAWMKGSAPASAAASKPQASAAAKKTNEEIAKEVLNGKWGNGEDRKKRLTAAGYDYTAIQTIVNKLVGGDPPAPATPTKSAASAAPEFKVGGKVMIKPTAKTYSRSTVTIPNQYKNKAYTIQQIGSDDALIKELYSWVKKVDVVRA